MASFVSNKGKWYPQKERVGLKNKSDKALPYEGESIPPNGDFVYKGPDRGALQMLHEEGTEHLGRDFRTDPEFIRAYRSMGFTSEKEYLKFVGYDEKADDEHFNERAQKVTLHELPQRVREIRVMGGAQDPEGGAQSHIGGFGDQRLRPANELSPTAGGVKK
jgi:hypothetical protein